MHQSETVWPYPTQQGEEDDEVQGPYVTIDAEGINIFRLRPSQMVIILKALKEELVAEDGNSGKELGDLLSDEWDRFTMNEPD